MEPLPQWERFDAIEVRVMRAALAQRSLPLQSSFGRPSKEPTRKTQ
jgi:hypothetical protein